MPTQVALYPRRAEVLSPLELQALAGGAPVELVAVSAPDVRFVRQLTGFVGVCAERLAAAGRNPDQAMQVLEALARSRHVLSLALSAPHDAPEPFDRLVTDVARATRALVFRDQCLADEEGRVLLRPDGQGEGPGQSLHGAEARDRKRRSEERLRAMGAPIDEAEPPIEATDEALLRSPREQALRAGALLGVVLRGEGLDAAEAQAMLAQMGAAEALSPAEQAFLATAEPSPAERRELVWQYEALWVLLWSLGAVETLAPPTTACDLSRAVRLVLEGPPSGQWRPRGSAELLDEADFHLRALAARRRATGGAAPGGLHADVLLERQRTFLWLRHHRYAPWDAVVP